MQGDLCLEYLECLVRSLIVEVFNIVNLEKVKRKIEQVGLKTDAHACRKGNKMSQRREVDERSRANLEV